MERSLSIMVSAGEASGDAHAAHAIEALGQLPVNAHCFGMGADALKAQGVDLIVDCRDLAVIGIADVLVNYPRFLKRLKRLREAMYQRKPDLLLLVDYPDFNLRLAETAKKLGVPVLFYISPKIWAWRSGRIHRIASLVTHMAVLFPFEVELYENAGVPVTYVGNPVVEDARVDLNREQACTSLGLNSRQPVIALLPGSRPGEIKRILPLMAKTVSLARTQDTTIQFVLPIAPTLEEQLLHSVLDNHLPEGLVLSHADSRIAMRAADVALVASGTATLETALIGTPMIVMYVVHPLNYSIMRRLIKIPDISLVNIVAGRRVVPEYLQNEARPDILSREILALLNDATRRADMLNDLQAVKAKMGDAGASSRVAQLIVEISASNTT